MLTPEHIAALRDRAGQITDPVVEFLIADIADRVAEAGQLTSTAAYEVWKLQKLGMSQKQLKKELQKRLKVSSGRLELLLTQAAETGYNFDLKRFPSADAIAFEDNTALQQILDAAIKQAQEDFTNLTQTMGFVGPDDKVRELTEAYQHACDYAFEKITTGAQDYSSAVRDATKGLAEKGILSLDYVSGVHRSLEAATRLNMMSGLGIMTERITQQNHDLLGCDGWEISAHMGSAPDHEPIQGKQYSDEEYTRLNNSLVRRIGTLNCGHSAMPIILGVNEPQYTDEELEEMRRKNEEGVTYNGKHYTLYEAEQRQHKLERAIRERKHRILIDEHLGDKDKLQTDQIRLQLLKQEYSRFSKAAGLPTQYERMEVAGFTWKHGKAAERVATEQAAANAEAMKFFGVNSRDDLKSVVKRSTIKTKAGFACFPDGDILNKSVKNVRPLELHFDVAMHGSPTSVGFGTTETNMSARTLAAIIRHSKGYKGQKIRLLSCNTGRNVGHNYCFAEELANALGVEVIAPNDVLYISPMGQLQVGDDGSGEFVIFKPNQRRRIK